mmetsp:Transcript_5530/g.11770  ORF Transcript_5530/g.11770 Transcript_5530/m.11770 type:complete len:84 (+) Transcript_5530:1068-1319(+)
MPRLLDPARAHLFPRSDRFASMACIETVVESVEESVSYQVDSSRAVKMMGGVSQCFTTTNHPWNSDFGQHHVFDTTRFVSKVD